MRGQKRYNAGIKLDLFWFRLSLLLVLALLLGFSRVFQVLLVFRSLPQKPTLQISIRRRQKTCMKTSLDWRGFLLKFIIYLLVTYSLSLWLNISVWTKKTNLFLDEYFILFLLFAAGTTASFSPIVAVGPVTRICQFFSKPLIWNILGPKRNSSSLNRLMRIAVLLFFCKYFCVHLLIKQR